MTHTVSQQIFSLERLCPVPLSMSGGEGGGGEGRKRGEQLFKIGNVVSNVGRGIERSERRELLLTEIPFDSLLSLSNSKT